MALTDSILMPALQNSFIINMIDRSSKQYYQTIPLQVRSYNYDLKSKELTISLDLDEKIRLLDELKDICEANSIDIVIDLLDVAGRITGRMLFQKPTMTCAHVSQNYANVGLVVIEAVFAVPNMLISSSDNIVPLYTNK